MEFYSATNKNEILSFLNKWIELELENISLSKVSQAQKANNCMDMCHTLRGEHTQKK
jgi:hypothetical protein